MSSIDRSKTSSRAAVSGSIPSLKSLPNSWVLRISPSFSGMLRIERAILLNFDILVLWRHSSLLFRSPYLPSSCSSASRMSIRQGNLGVSYFFRCFFGSPNYQLSSLFASAFLSYTYSFPFPSCSFGSLSSDFQPIRVTISSPRLCGFHKIYIILCL